MAKKLCFLLAAVRLRLHKILPKSDLFILIRLLRSVQNVRLCELKTVKSIYSSSQDRMYSLFLVTHQLLIITARSAFKVVIFACYFLFLFAFLYHWLYDASLPG